MKINSKYNLSLITKRAKREEMRPSMHNVKIEGSYAVATDSHILAVIPVELHEGEHTLDADFLFAKSPKNLDPCFEINDDEITNTRTKTSKKIDKTVQPFPDWRSVIPNRFKQGNYVNICLNPFMLLDLAKALGVKEKSDTSYVTVNLELNCANTTTKPMIITNSDDKAFGILMPIRLEKTCHTNSMYREIATQLNVLDMEAELVAYNGRQIGIYYQCPVCNQTFQDLERAELCFDSCKELLKISISDLAEKEFKRVGA